MIWLRLIVVVWCSNDDDNGNVEMHEGSNRELSVSNEGSLARMVSKSSMKKAKYGEEEMPMERKQETAAESFRQCQREERESGSSAASEAHGQRQCQGLEVSCGGPEVHFQSHCPSAFWNHS